MTEKPFDPEEQVELEEVRQAEIQHKKEQEAERFQREINALQRCPHCKKPDDWKPAANGLRCRHCGKFVAWTEENKSAMLRFVMLKQAELKGWPQQEEL